MAKEKHVEGEADHYIKTLIGAVLGYAADGLDMFLLSFILDLSIKVLDLLQQKLRNVTFSNNDWYVDWFIYLWIASR